MSVKVFVGRKSTGLPVHARSIPFLALCEIAVFVTNAAVGGPKIAIAASFEPGSGAAAVPHEKPPVPVSAPAYSTRAKSILLRGSGTPRRKIPTQSPAAGVASADVKTT